jgi:hypothetical protein
MRPAQLVRDVDQPGGGAGVPRFDPGDAGRGQRAQRDALPGADEDHRQDDPAHVRGVGIQAAEPESRCRPVAARSVSAEAPSLANGPGKTERDYAASCPGAKLGEGLAVRGEEVADAEPAVEAWLRRIGLLTR